MMAFFALVLLLVACGREISLEAVALEYARALYARDLRRAYQLISAQDRRWRGEAAFVAEGGAVTGNALELSRHLASFIEVGSVEKRISGNRAEVKLTLRLPDANAPAIARIAREWSEESLHALSESEMEAIRRALDRLHGDGTLPMLEGKETFQLAREAAGRGVLLNWVEGIRVLFRTQMPAGLPLRAAPPEQEFLVKPDEPIQMTVRLTNSSGRELSLRVAHVVEPKAAAPSLVFVQCPLLLPVNLRPHEAKDISTTFMVASGGPDQVKSFQVTFAFGPAQAPEP